jgi:hypothetical protein
MHALPGRHTWSVTFCNWLTIFRGLQRRETNRSVGWPIAAVLESYVLCYGVFASNKNR